MKSKGTKGGSEGVQKIISFVFSGKINPNRSLSGLGRLSKLFALIVVIVNLDHLEFQTMGLIVIIGYQNY